MRRDRRSSWSRAAAVAGSLLFVVMGCTRESRSPDAVRDRTANLTASVARNTKAVAQGVFEGLRRKGPLNINKASHNDIEALPGLTSGDADKIIAHRPYMRGSDLWRRKLITKKQYNQLSDRIATK